MSVLTMVFIRAVFFVWPISLWACGSFFALGTEIVGKVENLPVTRTEIGAPLKISPRRILITSGVHGNEVLSTPLAKAMLDRFQKDPFLKSRATLVLISDLNPHGAKNKTREMANGLDLNRSLPPHPKTKDNPAAEAVKEILTHETSRTQYDVAVDLHGAVFRDGFFASRAEEDPGFIKDIMGQVSPEVLLKSPAGQYPGKSEKNPVVPPPGVPLTYMLEGPGVVKPTSNGTIKNYLHYRGIPHAFTLEYPGKMDSKLREETLWLIFKALIEVKLTH